MNGNFPVYAAVHQDTRDRLEQFRSAHGLTVSGAVHHLLRLQLGLPPGPIKGPSQAAFRPVPGWDFLEAYRS